jgi:hypothetical protein
LVEEKKMASDQKLKESGLGFEICWLFKEKKEFMIIIIFWCDGMSG